MSFSYSDLVVPQPVVDVITHMSSSRSAFFGPGIAVVETNDGQGRGGNFVSRRYGAEDAAAGVPIDGTVQTPELVGAYADIAPVLRRMRFRRAVDGSGAAEGGALAINPTDRIMNQTIDWWTAEWDRAILAELAAAFHSTGALYATHLSDISVGTGAAVPLTFGAVVDASSLIGDRFRDLGVLVTHSKVAADLMKEAGQRVIAAPISGQPFMTDIWVGNLRLVVSDRCPVASPGTTYAKYTSFALAAGSVWAVDQQAITEFVAPNPSVPSIDYTQSWHRAIGITGLKWAVADANPADSVLDNPGSWSLTISPQTEASKKSIAVVGIVTNAG